MLASGKLQTRLARLCLQTFLFQQVVLKHVSILWADQRRIIGSPGTRRFRWARLKDLQSCMSCACEIAHAFSATIATGWDVLTKGG